VLGWDDDDGILALPRHPVTHLRYLTHADVVIDPDVPVARWGLSPLGIDRVRAMLGQPWVPAIRRVISSGETKAIETATILADHLAVEVEIRPGTGENDRTATGYLPRDEFDEVADTFFAEPDRSVRGWERAEDAQARIVAQLADLVAPEEGGRGDVAVVGHGAVGTLWLCHLSDLRIDRRHDQPGQGHYFTVDRTTGAVVHPWRPIDAIG